MFIKNEILRENYNKGGRANEDFFEEIVFGFIRIRLRKGK